MLTEHTYRSAPPDKVSKTSLDFLKCACIALSSFSNCMRNVLVRISNWPYKSQGDSLARLVIATAAYSPFRFRTAFESVHEFGHLFAIFLALWSFQAREGESQGSHSAACKYYGDSIVYEPVRFQIFTLTCTQH